MEPILSRRTRQEFAKEMEEKSGSRKKQAVVINDLTVEVDD